MDEREQAVVMKLEGKLVGPWVAEFSRTWQAFTPHLGARKLVVDLRGVDYIGADGRQAMAEIHRRTGAEFQTNSLLSEFYARQAMNGGSPNGKDGPK